MPDTVLMDWQVIVPVSVEPLTLADLRSLTTGSYLRVDFGDDDTVLQDLISDCRAEAERVTGKALAPQTLYVQYTLPQVSAGSLSGIQLMYDTDYYQYNESLGANPYQPAPFVLKLPMPPLVAITLFEYRVTAFDAWQTWPQNINGVNSYMADTIPVPGLVYLQYPPPAYQYRLTIMCGYTTIPYDIKLALKQLIAWKYENRDGEEMPPEILNTLMGRKSWVL